MRNACGVDVLRFATVGPSRILWSNSAESHETAGSWSRLGGKCLRDAFGNGLQDLTSNGHSIYIHLLQYSQQKNGADWKKTREVPWFILSSFHLKGTARSYYREMESLFESIEIPNSLLVHSQSLVVKSQLTYYFAASLSLPCHQQTLRRSG